VFGLDAAIEQLAQDMKDQYGIAFQYRCSKRFEPLEDDVRVLLYRTVREIFTNITKHSHASRVRVAMKQLSGYLRITVEDDGVGFDASQLTANMRKNKGFGLFSIRERLSYIGGTIDIESEPGVGTKIVITAPAKQRSGEKIGAGTV
jgi:signal transduction histidine kinase